MLHNLHKQILLPVSSCTVDKISYFYPTKCKLFHRQTYIFPTQFMDKKKFYTDFLPFYTFNVSFTEAWYPTDVDQKLGLFQPNYFVGSGIGAISTKLFGRIRNWGYFNQIILSDLVLVWYLNKIILSDPLFHTVQ